MCSSAPADQTLTQTGQVVSPADSQNEALLASQLPIKAPAPRFSWLTTTRLLVTANFLVFVAMLVYDYHVVGRDKFMDTPIAADFEWWIKLNWGSDYGVLTLGGQYWRVITSVFVHANIVHLSLNMLFLWSFGRYLDRMLGRTKSLIVYLLSGVASSLLSVSWHPGAVSAGASGAIYGQGGVLISFFAFGKLDLPRGRKIRLLIWMALLTPISLLTGHPVKDIDYAGHLGGFVGGLVMGIFLALILRGPREQHASRQRRLLLVTTAALIVIFAGVVLAHRNLIKLYHQELALRNKDRLQFLVAHNQRLVAEDPNNAIAHYDLGFAYHLQDKNEEALAEYRRALELDSGDNDTRYQLAFIYWRLGRFRDAVPLFRESLAHRTANSEDYMQFATALLAIKQMDEAEQVARKCVALDNSAEKHRFLALVLEVNGKRTEAKRERHLAEQLSQSKK